VLLLFVFLFSIKNIFLTSFESAHLPLFYQASAQLDACPWIEDRNNLLRSNPRRWLFFGTDILPFLFSEHLKRIKKQAKRNYNIPTRISDPSRRMTWQEMKSRHFAGAGMCFFKVINSSYLFKTTLKLFPRSNIIFKHFFEAQKQFSERICFCGWGFDKDKRGGE